MASIQTREKNGKPSYTVKIRVKGSPPVFKTFSRLTDARNWAQKTESDIREGLYFKKHESRKHTLKELIKRYTYRKQRVFFIVILLATRDHLRIKMQKRILKRP